MAEDDDLSIMVEALINMKLSVSKISSMTGLDESKIEDKIHIISEQSKAKSTTKFSQEIINEALSLFEQEKTDTDISKIIGVSTTTLRRWRKEYNFEPSDGNEGYSEEQLNYVIDLIVEGYTIGEIREITGVTNVRIKEHHQECINKGLALPEIKLGIARRTKYSDEELVELVFQNQGYGFKRFVNYLGISENYLFDLLKEFKEYFGDNIYDHLQDTSNHKEVSFAEYKKITGHKVVPPSLAIRGGGHGRRGANQEHSDRLRRVMMPPQEFQWGEIRRKDDF